LDAIQDKLLKIGYSEMTGPDAEAYKEEIEILAKQRETLKAGGNLSIQIEVINTLSRLNRIKAMFIFEHLNFLF
jgi:hypothetical protein